MNWVPNKDMDANFFCFYKYCIQEKRRKMGPLIGWIWGCNKTCTKGKLLTISKSRIPWELKQRIWIRRKASKNKAKSWKQLLSSYELGSYFCLMFILSLYEEAHPKFPSSYLWATLQQKEWKQFWTLLNPPWWSIYERVIMRIWLLSFACHLSDMAHHHRTLETCEDNSHLIKLNCGVIS